MASPPPGDPHLRWRVKCLPAPTGFPGTYPLGDSCFKIRHRYEALATPPLQLSPPRHDASAWGTSCGPALALAAARPAWTPASWPPMTSSTPRGTASTADAAPMTRAAVREGNSAALVSPRRSACGRRRSEGGSPRPSPSPLAAPQCPLAFEPH